MVARAGAARTQHGLFDLNSSSWSATWPLMNSDINRTALRDRWFQPDDVCSKDASLRITGRVDLVPYLLVSYR